MSPCQCPSSAAVPPQGAPDGSGQLGTPRARPSHWDHSRGFTAQLLKPAASKRPVSLRLTIQVLWIDTDIVALSDPFPVLDGLRGGQPSAMLSQVESPLPHLLGRNTHCPMPNANRSMAASPKLPRASAARSTRTTRRSGARPQARGSFARGSSCCSRATRASTSSTPGPSGSRRSRRARRTSPTTTPPLRSPTSAPRCCLATSSPTVTYLNI